jgi:hypothetical protein
VITLATPSIVLAMILMLGLALGLLVWGVCAAIPRVNRLVERSFRCPSKDLDVTAEFQEDPWDGRLIRVERCSAFVPPTAIECDHVCLGLANPPATHVS